MTQRSSHRDIAEMTRPATVTGLLWLRGEPLAASVLLISLSLVLLITNGGAG